MEPDTADRLATSMPWLDGAAETLLAAWGEVVAFAVLNAAGLLYAIVTGEWRLKQMYEWFYFPIAGTFWALDTGLARARHFPAIDWNRSYTLYDLGSWFAAEVGDDWEEHRAWARALLQQETQLLEVVQLLGADALAPPQRVVLRIGRLLREDFLQQSAFDDEDAYCDLRKQVALLRVIRRAHMALAEVVERGVSPEEAGAVASLTEIAAARFWPVDEAAAHADALAARIESDLKEIE